MRRSSIPSLGQPSYSLNFKELNNLIYKYSSKLSQLDIQTLNSFFLQSLNPEDTIKTLKEVLNQPKIQLNPHTVETLLQNIWKRILIRNNIIIIFIKILQLSCRFLTPYLLDELTNNFKIEDQDHSVEVFGLGTTISLEALNWIYAIILVFIMVFGVFLDTQQTWHLNRLRYQGKTVLQFLLYYKLVVAKSVERGGSDANLNNLVSSDCDTFVNIFYNFHEAWASLVNLAVIIVILFFKMRKALPIGLMVVVILLWLTSRVSKGMAKLNPEILKIRDKRIELTGDIVQGIKSIKYLCWEAVFQGKLLELRKKEFDLISKMKYLDSFCVILWGLTSISIITATFIAYSLMGYDIVKVNVFTDIAYFQMLIAPLNSLPWTIGAVINSLNALKRIKSYLGKEELGRSKENIEGETLALKMKIKRMTWPQIDQEKAFFALKNIDLELKKGSLNMVIGSVSAGKSALLNAILDEMKPLTKKEELNMMSKQEVMSPEGFVNSPLLPEAHQLNNISVKGKIAYVSQNPWLQKQTIRENILFGKEYESGFYRKCLEACDLVSDIKKLSEGDNHDVGLNGSNLSGGQRQRISLCRALYQDADIYLLDDILSSVDVSVANILFQKAVINLLKERNKTIILVLSQYKYLRYADRVLLIQRGQVLETPSSIKNFIESSGNEYNTSPGVSPSLFVDSTSRKLGEEQSEEKNEKEIQEKGEQKEEISRGGVKIQTLLAYINAMGTFVFLLIWVGGILMQGSRAWFDFWLKDYIACKAQSETPGFFLVNFEVTLVILMVFSVACWAFRAMIFAYGNLKAGEKMFRMLVPRVLYAPMEFFDRNPIGKVVQRFSEDTWTLDYEFAFRWNMLLNNLMIFARVLYVFAINVPVILTLMLPGATIFYSLQDKYRKVSRELKRMDSISHENLLNHLAETIAGTVVIRAFQKEQFMIQGFLGKVKEALITRSIMETMRIWFSLRLKSLSILVSSLVLLFSLGYKYYYGNTANFSDLSLILLYALTSPLNFEDIMITLADSERELIGIERINEYLTNSTENTETSSDDTSREAIKSSSEIIQFQNVSLKYQKDDKQQDYYYALKNLSLSISKNEKIALCGRTGSGKTTVLNALLRLYETESGNIRFKGRDIQDISIKELRSSIAVIPQFGFMYEAGLLENLDPYGEISAKKVEEVLNKGKNIIEKAVRKSEEIEENEGEDKVELFDKKFVIERGGQNLSNGEKQVVSFLRILLKDSDVIFLDEATSNVDPTTDELMHKALFEMSEGKTLIVITHRLEYLKHYDRIILMENGEIVDQGTYQEITNKSEGKLNKFIEENSRS